MSYYDNVNFADLKGKTLVEIKADTGSVTFITSTGESYSMYHDQDCCEHVRIESVVGDWKDLLGYPVLLAEEVSNADNPDYKYEPAESYTWTFYKLATIKGYVDIRWLGESNGYYSESVSMHKGSEYSQEEVLEFVCKNGLKITSLTKNESEQVAVKSGQTFAQAVQSTQHIVKKDGENKGTQVYKKKSTRFNL